MKKVLIWDISFPLRNVGGPSGYLYNIHEYLRANPCEQIVFLSDLLNKEETNNQSYRSASIWRRIVEQLKQSRLLSLLNDLAFVLWKEYNLCNVHLPASVHLEEYDFVHFHQANDVRRYASLYKNKNCKTILTTHCPCPRTDEVLARRPRFFCIFAPIIRKQERLCYEKADYLMFPCKEAREPYEKDKKINAIFHRMESKFFYCPTAIQDVTYNASSLQHLSDYGIPDNAFVIAFFGRHNEIKGYDILKQIGEKLLKTHHNLYFLCAGKGDITGLQHPRWIELGFVNNTDELLRQCDLYILPNRETYFDLVVLEVLRSATPILLADNGGNRYFKLLPEEERKGLSFISTSDLDDVCEKVGKVIAMKIDNPAEYQELGNGNRNLYNKYFTPQKYVENYVEQISKL